MSTAPAHFPSTLRVALVHDWLVSYRGGEKVLASLCRLFPQAPIYTLFYQPGSQPDVIASHPIIESPLAKLPGARRRHRWLLPLYPWAAEQFDLSDYDLVISSSHAVAKGVITHADALHVSYVHTPMRYAWDLAADYRRTLPWLARPLWDVTLPWLRAWDELSASRVDHYLCNSHTVRRRIAKRYRREAQVIYPPVDVARFAGCVGQPKGHHYVTVSALVPYKRVDLLIRACAELKRELVVIGDGPQRAALERIAAPGITLLGHVSDQTLTHWLGSARAFLFAAEEDFGISVVEALAAGLPVIAYGRGGAQESVSEALRTGIHFPEQSVTSIKQAILRFEAESHLFNGEGIAAQVQHYSPMHFEESLRGTLERLITAHHPL